MSDQETSIQVLEFRPAPVVVSTCTECENTYGSIIPDECPVAGGQCVADMPIDLEQYR
jgi:hypothetical protein